MALSSPFLHARMVVAGWDHAALMAMDEEEFLFWADAQDDYDEALSAARERAAQG